MAADGAGVDHRRHDRGWHSRFRRDLFHRGEHAHPESVPGGTDFLSGGIHARADGRPRRVWLRVLLLGCLPERVLLGERSIVIVPGHVSADERVCIRAYIPVSERIRVPEPPLVRFSVADPGLATSSARHADADHISTDIDAAEHARDYGIFGTCNFGTARIHVGEHRNIGMPPASA